jgi:hypothetical protein
MKNFLRGNSALVIAFALPILLILIVTVTTYLPSLLLTTKYNFLYATCIPNNSTYSYACDTSTYPRYIVQNKKIVESGTKPNNTNTSRIFYHDTKSNTSREISPEDAKRLTVDEKLTSPDNVTVTDHYQSGVSVFPFFDSNSSYGYYLTNGANKRKLNLISDTNTYYRSDFQFLGWIISEPN